MGARRSDLHLPRYVKTYCTHVSYLSDTHSPTPTSFRDKQRRGRHSQFFFIFPLFPESNTILDKNVTTLDPILFQTFYFLDSIKVKSCISQKFTLNFKICLCLLNKQRKMLYKFCTKIKIFLFFPVAFGIILSEFGLLCVRTPLLGSCFQNFSSASNTHRSKAATKAGFGK